ncbi:TMV resistance protein N-like [Dorcoceras hygrometricum]|uniref:TMV resistance protein N-like n=1 Tax=Dorcoceras hygrometricum TaxID=472368 RepID=A0A2Z6ZQN8_9LAMI|nr:TMV resistance protein N-like [Dorcoceras hygrometricum]
MSLWIIEKGIDGVYVFCGKGVRVCFANSQCSQRSKLRFLLIDKDGNKRDKYGKLGWPSRK